MPAGEEATGSDHELIAWEVLGTPDPGDDTSIETTGWDISGWDPMNESENEEKEKRRKGEKGRGNAMSGWWTQHPFSPMAAGPRRW